MNRRRRRRMVLIGATLAGLPLAVSVALVSIANAHGSMITPISRTLQCRLEGPENPQSAACQAAIALGGTQPVYDWNEVNIPNADGRHRELIPDGELCSAGRDKYRGFDLARADWPATDLPTGGPFTFRYRATAPHVGTFFLFVTRDSYDPTQPLRWDDLEPEPFLEVDRPPLVDETYVMPGELPAGKSGRHLIYSIWQRADSPEAFYTCSDVVFGDETPPTTPPPTTPPPTTPPPTTPPPTTPPPSSPPPGEVVAWQPHTGYQPGDLVTFGGQVFACRQTHTSLPGWEPPQV
ncbi:MAG: lytic polysaccharide monooxygenase, partial [Natronosporangium sp.]